MIHILHDIVLDCEIGRRSVIGPIIGIDAVTRINIGAGTIDLHCTGGGERGIASIDDEAVDGDVVSRNADQVATARVDARWHDNGFNGRAGSTANEGSRATVGIVPGLGTKQGDRFVDLHRPAVRAGININGSAGRNIVDAVLNGRESIDAVGLRDGAVSHRFSLCVGGSGMGGGVLPRGIDIDGARVLSHTDRDGVRAAAEGVEIRRRVGSHVLGGGIGIALRLVPCLHRECRRPGGDTVGYKANEVGGNIGQDQCAGVTDGGEGDPRRAVVG